MIIKDIRRHDPKAVVIYAPNYHYVNLFTIRTCPTFGPSLRSCLIPTEPYVVCASLFAFPQRRRFYLNPLTCAR